ncbi:hypothetical protein [Fodinibius halophilus]|uniref:Porin family protein n=1 Tax=Fodinibius halophilus TaxID=1736908 RepID=A0A6M1T0B9_9BACT|nr:hypothetical protein [Fodinibius halophilus]NGP88926.1 hypothetical protein [Fodinibius halophilus]
MKIVTKSFLFSLLLFMASSTAFAQNQPAAGNVGISASVQGQQINFQLPFWTSESVSIAPIFGLDYREDNFTTLNIGIYPRFYQDIGSDFGAFLGARGLLRYTSPNVGDNETDILIGPTGGGEYYLSEHFSLGVEGQLNFLLNDNGSNRLSTGTAVMATYYF